MYEDRKALRDRATAKAKRLAEGSPGKVDASSYSAPASPTASDVQTGAKPISRRAFKRGGKVANLTGAKAKADMGKKPRGQNSPTTPTSMINRDAKAANAQRPGKQVVGAFKKGGAAHDDVREDKKLIKSMVKPAAMKKASGGQTVNRVGKGDYAGKYPADMSNDTAAKIQASEAASAKKEREFEANQPHKRGGRAKKEEGGGISDILTNATKLGGGKKNNGNDALKNAAMIGAMGGGLLPMGIAAALGKKKGGSVSHSKGCGCKMCCGGRAKRASGGKVGRTNINIVISPKSDAPAPGPAPMPPAPPPMMGKPPMAPGGPGGAPPIPPQLLAAMAGGAGPGPRPGMPPRPFKRGGSVSSYKDMTAGAGSGEGRIEKTEIAAKSHR